MSDIVYFFAGWEPLGRILIVGTAMYVLLLVMLRLSGSRSLSNMHSFDFIVTVAIGSAFGRALTAKSVALAEAVVAFLLLITLQYVVAWVRTRSSAFSAVVTNSPRLLYYRGRFLREAMGEARIVEAELRSAVRKQKLGSMESVEAIVLESSGELSVITALGDRSAFGEIVEDQIGPHPADAPGEP